MDAFGIGTTSDCFHSVGIWPDWIDRLNNLVTIGAILEAVFFNIEAMVILQLFAQTLQILAKPKPTSCAGYVVS